VAYCSGLENRRSYASVGSNPTPAAFAVRYGRVWSGLVGLGWVRLGLELYRELVHRKNARFGSERHGVQFPGSRR
jgi:hypothetical protein